MIYTLYNIKDKSTWGVLLLFVTMASFRTGAEQTGSSHNLCETHPKDQIRLKITLRLK